MKMKRSELGFWESFGYYNVIDEWKVELYNYIMKGLAPGSFHEAIYCNDLKRAVQHSHPMNTWDSIREFVLWLVHESPPGCWGDYETYEKWINLSDDERNILLLKHKFVMPPEKVMWNIITDTEDINTPYAPS